MKNKILLKLSKRKKKFYNYSLKCKHNKNLTKNYIYNYLEIIK